MLKFKNTAKRIHEISFLLNKSVHVKLTQIVQLIFIYFFIHFLNILKIYRKFKYKSNFLTRNKTFLNLTAAQVKKSVCQFIS